MKVWVDADACPVAIKDIVSRAVHRLKIETIFVANKSLTLAESEFISLQRVAAGPDVADTYIAENAQAGDLVVTQDIHLAARLIPLTVSVVSPRGFRFSEDNINDVVATRDLMHSLRDVGTMTGGMRPFDEKVKRDFANIFHSELQRLMR